MARKGTLRGRHAARLAGGVLSVAALLLLPWPATAAASRIAIVVDNSGSMYGNCSPGPCEDISPDVKHALRIILELTDAYNADKAEADQVDVVLTLFGGAKSKDDPGQPEFQEVELSGVLSTDLTTLEREIQRDRGYHGTDFTTGFRGTAEALARRGRADTSIFLTDARNHGTGAADGIDLTLFGRTYLYGFRAEARTLDQWEGYFEDQGGHAEVHPLRYGWQVSDSFITVFVKLLASQAGQRYLTRQALEVGPGNAQVDVRKLGDGAATLFLVHAQEALRLSGVQRGDQPVDPSAYTSRSGTSLLTLQLAEGSEAGVYSLLFESPKHSQVVTAILIDGVSLVLVDRLHLPGTAEEHKRNEEVGFHFGFAAASAPEGVLLDAESERSFLDLIDIRIVASESEGTDLWDVEDPGSSLQRTHVFAPSVTGDSRYAVQTGWSYVSAVPEASFQAGEFVLSEFPAQELRLSFASDRGADIWEARDVRASARWVEGPDPIRDEHLNAREIRLRHESSGREFVLSRSDDESPYSGDLGGDLGPGTHTFALLAPDPGETPGIVLTGRELKIQPRAIRVNLRETFAREALPEEEKLIARIRAGLRFLLGKAGGETETREVVLDSFPQELEVLLLYYGAAEHELVFSLEIDPVFEDETPTVGAALSGNRAFDARDAWQPRLFGLSRGRKTTVEDALAIDLDPDPPAGTPGQTTTVKLVKANCDWNIKIPLAPAPELTYEPALERAGVVRELEPAVIRLSVKTRPLDQQIINALRKSAITALLFIALLIVLTILALLMAWRARDVSKMEVWNDLLKRAPWDFCRRELVGTHFPKGAFRRLEKFVEDEPSEKPYQRMRKLITSSDPADRKELRRLRWASRKSELEALRARCKQQNLKASWEFDLAPSQSVAVCGTDADQDERAVRLRDRRHLRSDQGRVALVSERGRGGAAPRYLVSYHPSEHLPCRVKGGEVEVPPHRGPLEIEPGSYVDIGPDAANLRIRLSASYIDGRITVTTTPL